MQVENMTRLEVEQELDRIYDLEELFENDSTWDYLNEVLAHIDVEAMDATFLMAYAVVTKQMAPHLPARQPLLAAFHKKYPQYKHIT